MGREAAEAVRQMEDEARVRRALGRKEGRQGRTRLLEPHLVYLPPPEAARRARPGWVSDAPARRERRGDEGPGAEQAGGRGVEGPGRRHLEGAEAAGPRCRLVAAQGPRGGKGSGLRERLVEERHGEEAGEEEPGVVLGGRVLSGERSEGAHRQKGAVLLEARQAARRKIHPRGRHRRPSGAPAGRPIRRVRGHPGDLHHRGLVRRQGRPRGRRGERGRARLDAELVVGLLPFGEALGEPLHFVERRRADRPRARRRRVHARVEGFERRRGEARLLDQREKGRPARRRVGLGMGPRGDSPERGPRHPRHLVAPQRVHLGRRRSREGREGRGEGRAAAQHPLAHHRCRHRAALAAPRPARGFVSPGPVLSSAGARRRRFGGAGDGVGDGLLAKLVQDLPRVVAADGAGHPEPAPVPRQLRGEAQGVVVEAEDPVRVGEPGALGRTLHAQLRREA
mmetsp:Transcript_46730/g.105646  ORF Transcript_46730/g.105646 Transcript_46730/m.105646 type:complete len:453 (-) Transcript_46730:515-1873(-)